MHLWHLDVDVAEEAVAGIIASIIGLYLIYLTATTMIIKELFLIPAIVISCIVTVLGLIWLYDAIKVSGYRKR